jgi:hypothetical protein
MWAGPDAPELYFLSGLPNRTRTLFDFLDAPAVSTLPLVQRLEAIGAKLVVVKERPLFSRALTEAQLDTLRASFPGQRSLRGFLVLWR